MYLKVYGSFACKFYCLSHLQQTALSLSLSSLEANVEQYHQNIMAAALLILSRLKSV